MIGRIPLRIRRGPNRGLRWSLASSGRGAVAGDFEERRVTAFLRLLRPGDVVWDIGAHKGYLTLAASGAVGARGHVYAIEPARENLVYLRRHVAWNGRDNINVVPVAMSDRDESARFGGSGSSTTFRLGQGDTVVDVRTLSTLIRTGLASPHAVKIDVEGSEAAVLRGAADTLLDDMVLLIAIHSRTQYEECRAQLEQRGFRVYRSGAMIQMMERLPAGWSPDPDLLAVGPGRELSPDAIAYFTAVP
ncbi:MAG TPA: FkbM family methyltransferase [Longimicrobiales bacterium]|nr:FkbM family methyltransferase [Longimicrobiales bacterium]